MTEPVIFTATVAAWMATYNDPIQLLENVEAGRVVDAIGMLVFYGAPNKEKFGNWIRVGDAQMTVTLHPRDEQVRHAVALLQEELNHARVQFMTRQQEILERINKLQAITYEAPGDDKTRHLRGAA